ncbi:MAG: GNAT family N-acetyltransferase, partial [Gemmataceae bacterium]|nr:GNAT family N-acetyltransferase [Gemmataceae bacterium]
MTSLYVVRPEQPEWAEVLAQSFQHDFYHLPRYHTLARQQGEGEPYLFVYHDSGEFLALPLLLRRVNQTVGLQSAPEGWQDATSVYGYAGPLASRPDLPREMIRGFQAALGDALAGLQVVSVFSRLHPLIPQAPFLDGLGACRHSGETVSIDLTLPPDKQRACYRRTHRFDINRLHRLGGECLRDPEFARLGDFIALYHETMTRVDAAPSFFFPPAYFDALRAGPHPDVHLFVCTLQGRVVCGALFLACAGILQYHLSGTYNQYLALAPMKLLLDEVRGWATEQGFRMLHLGGGSTDAPEDSLLHFKAGFSDRRHAFHTWRWVVQEEAYQQLCALKRGWNEQNGQRYAVANFFPEYRAATA